MKWHGDFYDYHGGCDLVLITNSILDFHIRTKNFSSWSGIDAAAIRIGGDKLEVQESGTIVYNNIISTATPPATVGGYPFFVLPGPPIKYRLNMTGGQYIEITRTYGSTLQVDVRGHGSDFGTSQGLCANWTANSPNALVDRDKVTVYPYPPVLLNAYGEEWQVNATLGDPLLFQNASSDKCQYSQGGGCKQTGTPECQEQQNRAKIACANVPTARNAQVNCEFDVLTTGDVNAAKAIAYTDPIIGDPPELCTEIKNVTVANATVDKVTTDTGCKDKGGKCVWRCDKNMNICADSLCRGPSDGCACALPLPAPVPAPVAVPTPVKPTTTAPVPTGTAPVPTPIKPVPTAPVKPVPTAPVPVKETKPPTKAPIDRKSVV